MAEFEAAYLKLHRSGELERRSREGRRRQECCDLCGRRCGVNRLKSAKGAACHTGRKAVISSAHPHFGEESPLVGRNGSGTIFISWCNLGCRFCQNYETSQYGEGREMESAEIAKLMLGLQSLGCHNVNFVSPTHVVPQLLEALVIAADKGLELPLVYNTGGYDCEETLALLDGVIDIYMPDMKYGDDETALEYSRIERYWEVNRAAVKEMHRQVGDLAMDEEGVARRGLLVRHLVLPENLARTDIVAKYLAEEISPDTYLNIMDQYRPCHRISGFPPMNRRITPEEFDQAVETAKAAGLRRFDHDFPRRRVMWLRFI